jgi:hypothetical protein
LHPLRTTLKSVASWGHAIRLAEGAAEMRGISGKVLHPGTSLNYQGNTEFCSVLMP